MRKTLLSIAATLALTSITMAQNVPTYVPTNGLVGWWPFNGNANDESVSANNLTINGAQLTVDRFGNTNQAYLFNGSTDYLYRNAFTGINDCSISIWVNMANYPTTNIGSEFVANGYGASNGFGLKYASGIGASNKVTIVTYGNSYNATNSNYNSNLNNWYNFVVSKTVNSYSLYVNGSLNSSGNSVTNSFLGLFAVGAVKSSSTGAFTNFFSGKLDDVGFWNRALTPQEITNLYNGNICYQNITVTDTLLINMGITGFNPVTYQNTIKVWPNPTNDHITIDNGNLANLNGYQIKIMNSLSQQVFQSAITQQQFYIDLSSWTGNGIYFVHIIDGQGNTVDVKKIILQ